MDVAAEDGENDLRLLKVYVRIIREQADVFLGGYAPPARVDANRDQEVLGDEVDAPDCNFLRDPRRFLTRIRSTCDMLMAFLDRPEVGRMTAAVWQERHVVFAVVKKFAKVLGVVSVLFGISAMICFHDWRLLNRVLIQRFSGDMKTASEKIEELERRVNSIYNRVSRTAERVKTILSTSDHTGTDLYVVRRIVDEIRDDIKLCRLEMQFSQDLLDGLKVKTAGYIRSMLIKNTVVLTGVTAVSALLYHRRVLSGTTAVALTAAGCVPLWYVQFHVLYRLYEMTLEIHEKKVSIKKLNLTLRGLSYQLKQLEQQRTASPRGFGNRPVLPEPGTFLDSQVMNCGASH